MFLGLIFGPGIIKNLATTVRISEDSFGSFDLQCINRQSAVFPFLISSELSSEWQTFLGVEI